MKKIISIVLSLIFVLQSNSYVYSQALGNGDKPMILQMEAPRDVTNVYVNRELQEFVINERLTEEKLNNYIEKSIKALENKNYQNFKENFDLSLEIALKNYLSNTTLGIKSLSVINEGLYYGLIDEKTRKTIQKDLYNYIGNIERCRGENCQYEAIRAVTLVLSEKRLVGSKQSISLNVEKPNINLDEEGQRNKELLVKKIKENYGNLEEDIAIKEGYLEALALNSQEGLEKGFEEAIKDLSIFCRSQIECEDYQLGLTLTNNLSKYGKKALPILTKIIGNERKYPKIVVIQAYLVLGAYYGKGYIGKLNNIYCNDLMQVENPYLDQELSNQIAGVYSIYAKLPIEQQEFDRNGKVNTYYYDIEKQERLGICGVHYKHKPDYVKLSQWEGKEHAKGAIQFMAFGLSFFYPVVLTVTFINELGKEVKTTIKDDRTLREAGPSLALNATFLILGNVGNVKKFANVLKESQNVITKGKVATDLNANIAKNISNATKEVSNVEKTLNTTSETVNTSKKVGSKGGEVIPSVEVSLLEKPLVSVNKVENPITQQITNRGVTTSTKRPLKKETLATRGKSNAKKKTETKNQSNTNNQEKAKEKVGTEEQVGNGSTTSNPNTHKTRTRKNEEGRQVSSTQHNRSRESERQKIDSGKKTPKSEFKSKKNKQKKLWKAEERIRKDVKIHQEQKKAVESFFNGTSPTELFDYLKPQSHNVNYNIVGGDLIAQVKNGAISNSLLTYYPQYTKVDDIKRMYSNLSHVKYRMKDGKMVKSIEGITINVEDAKTAQLIRKKGIKILDKHGLEALDKRISRNIETANEYVQGKGYKIVDEEPFVRLISDPKVENLITEIEYKLKGTIKYSELEGKLKNFMSYTSGDFTIENIMDINNKNKRIGVIMRKNNDRTIVRFVRHEQTAEKMHIHLEEVIPSKNGMIHINRSIDVDIPNGKTREEVINNIKKILLRHEREIKSGHNNPTKNVGLSSFDLFGKLDYNIQNGFYQGLNNNFYTA